MKLTSAQIDQLYTFTKQHYVEYYDLQTELVDHLANAIELEWESNPTLSFETLLNKEFKKFVVFGFMDVVEEKQKAMNKIYNKLVWGHFKTFFNLCSPPLNNIITFLKDLTRNVHRSFSRGRVSARWGLNTM